MPADRDYSPDDWNLLMELPFKAILAAVVSDVHGEVGSANEEIASAAKELVSSANAHAENSLIQAVIATVLGDSSAEPAIALDDEEARREVVGDALNSAAIARELLSEHANAEEARGYLDWIADAVEAAIQATRSGGILGVRAPQVSETEANYLEHLLDALGLPQRDPEEGL
jgi:hypothetical protein